ncbi:MAG: xanthine dehydrogenase family protein molybdopterin-binding subunit [Defluviicoccus sp.]|nr:xanthine dehydrogenase family protein molybdopterin-binding subunit [Defluviicoccus sp.]MDE0382423.1 xanthine dehydrogenase family protein molybdopterin-binding subunit [Defluviicoccus sp.]
MSTGRLEDARLLRGQGRFTDDPGFPGALHGVVLRSTHPSAVLRRVDIAAALGVDGVAGVVTAEDLARDGIGGLAFMSTVEAPGGGPVATMAMPLLAGGAVRYVGEPVAFAVAESPAAARDAAERIAVDYAPEDCVTDPASAALPGAPRVQEGGGNVVGELRMGDPAGCRKALDGARHRLRLRIRNNRLVPHPMEPRAAIGLYDAAGGTWTLHCANQAPHHGRAVLASVLGVPKGRIAIRVGDIGGAFGGRVTPCAEDALVLYAARRFGRPVRWRGERAETFLGDYHARDHVSEVEIGFGDGLGIVALRVVDHANLGAYATPFGIPIATTTGNRIATGAYRVPVADIAVKTVLTNTVPTGPYRGAGRPEAIFRLERVLDVAARRLGIDPAELRRRNLVRKRELPYRVVSGLAYDSGDFPRLLDRALALADWDGFAARSERSRSRHMLRGRGLAYHIDSTSGLSPRETADAVATREGRVRLHSGTQEMGQGLKTTYAQMAGAIFGLPREAVDIVQGDTAATPEGPGSYGSRSLYTGGSAVAVACETLIQRLKTLAALRFEASPEDVAFADARLSVAGTDLSVAMGELAAAEPGGEIRATGGAEAPFCFPNGCYVCEVEIDPETGGVRIDRFHGVDDSGRIVNLPIAHGQTHGGLAQGIGQAVLEEIRYDPATGQLLTGSPMDYALPRADDLPRFQTVLDEGEPTATNILGVKGAGESGAVGGPPAVASAVLDALRARGVEHLDMPFTPERVWRALR